MKPRQLKSTLLTAVKAKRPTFVWGSPGIGKSDIVRQVADDLYASEYGLTIDANGRLRDTSGKFVSERPYVVDLRMLLLDPVDLRGLPRLNGDNLAHWCPPDFLPKSGKGILFLDELNAAPPLVQAGGYGLTLDRKIGEYRLPEGWDIIAAGNRETDRAVTHRMPSPLANRFTHVEMEPDLEDWTKISLTRNIRTDVIAFARFRPAMLFNFDPAKNEKSFATPRSWWNLSDLLNTNPPADIEMEICTGTVGRGAGTEFLAFKEMVGSLPNIDKIILSPDKSPVPKDNPGAMFALATGLARKMTDANIAQICTYLLRIPKEFSVLTMTQAVELKPDLATTRDFIRWAEDHAEVLV